MSYKVAGLLQPRVPLATSLRPLPRSVWARTPPGFEGPAALSDGYSAMCLQLSDESQLGDLLHLISQSHVPCYLPSSPPNPEGLMVGRREVPGHRLALGVPWGAHPPGGDQGTVLCTPSPATTGTLCPALCSVLHICCSAVVDNRGL